MPKFDPLAEPLPMHIQVADAIKKAIMRGDLKFRERLPLEELGKELGVSRMPVREALIRLEKEGLVVFNNRRGAEVAGITLEQVLDITNLRSMLESDALKRAKDHYEPQHFVEARSILKKASRTKDADELGDLHWQFHHCLYAPCNRPIQMEMIDTLHSNVERIFRMLWRDSGLRSNWIEDHNEILVSLEKGDLEKALVMVEDHMQVTTDRIAGFLNSQ